MINIKGVDFKYREAQSKQNNGNVVIIKNPTYAQGKSVTRKNDFEKCKFDLIEIKNAIDGDSYLKVATDKYVDLIFKEGYYLHSKNPKAKEYIQGRLDNIAAISKINTKDYIDSCARMMVSYANAFTRIKKEDVSVIAQSTNLVLSGDERNQVIAGLFPMHAASVYILRDQNNNIIKYQQRDIAQSKAVRGDNTIPDKPSGGDIKEWPVFAPEEVIHMTIACEPGYVFGNPYLAPAVDDIKALRMIEEHAARLIYRYLFPTQHVKVGLPTPGFQASEEEVQSMEEKIVEVPYDGTIVTSERVDIDVTGAMNHALDPMPTLEHYKKRAFTGMGVSPVQMGESETSNRATADALTTEMHDRIITYQNRMSMYLGKLFDAILIEGNFDLSNYDNKVELRWNPIEIETKIKKDAHVIFKYNNDIITAEEMRNELGYDPFTTEEEKRLKSTINAERMAEYDKTADSIVQPENQHGKKSGPKKKSENVLVDFLEKSSAIVYYESNMNMCISEIGDIYKLLINDVTAKRNEHTISYALRKMNNKVSKYMCGVFDSGKNNVIGRYKQYAMNPGHDRFKYELLNDFKEGFSRYSDLIHTLTKDTNDNNVGFVMESVFKMITRYIRTLLHKAYSVGFASGCRTSKVKAVVVANNECDKCKDFNNKEVKFNGVQFENLPGFHMNCTCGLDIL